VQIETKSYRKLGWYVFVSKWLKRKADSYSFTFLPIKASEIFLISSCAILDWGIKEPKLESKKLEEWIAIAKGRPKWRQQNKSKPKPPDA